MTLEYIRVPENMRMMMTLPTVVRAPQPSGATWPRWLVRLTSTVTAILLFDQSIFAGQFLGGSYDSLHLHRQNAIFCGVAVVLTLVAALMLRWRGHGPWWPVFASAGLLFLIYTLFRTGLERYGLHIPFGVATIVTSVLLMLWSWRRS